MPCSWFQFDVALIVAMGWVTRVLSTYEFVALYGVKPFASDTSLSKRFNMPSVVTGSTAHRLTVKHNWRDASDTVLRTASAEGLVAITMAVTAR